MSTASLSKSTISSGDCKNILSFAKEWSKGSWMMKGSKRDMFENAWRGVYLNQCWVWFRSKMVLDKLLAPVNRGRWITTWTCHWPRAVYSGTLFQVTTSFCKACYLQRCKFQHFWSHKEDNHFFQTLNNNCYGKKERIRVFRPNFALLSEFEFI